MNQPPWAQPDLNIDRCVELHTEILRLGWQGMGRDPQNFETKNWFDTYGTEADKMRKYLSKELVAYLERAGVSNDWSFHWYVYGLQHPDYIFFWDELFSWKGGYMDKKRYVVLYGANDISEHQVGLVFDQKTNTAIMCMDVDEAGAVTNGRLRWYPLDTVLEAWLDMIKKEKVKATKPHEMDLERFEPWVLVRYTDSGLNETINTFNSLVEAIESRIPGFDIHAKDISYGLVDQTTLDAANIMDGFGRQFLLRARRPRFLYIAPGLQTISSSTFSHNPFLAVFNNLPISDKPQGRTPEDIPPLLLFFSTQSYTVADPNRADRGPFYWPYQNMHIYPAGLYLPQHTFGLHRFDDECTLVLPFGIGGNGYARTSDGALFGENKNEELPRAKDVHTSLYQPGHRPFGEMHGVVLRVVLESWLGMVERGDWKIGKEGVQGGMKTWKDADRSKTWERYSIAPSW
ncbi:hypothetical protein P280DRAFT_411396 [Massarina eburnea CBS 473.64]|uniref:Uncharacterized protein n=1 Tax=Massarina eburnea CBS 473.64 TaxID=1395130 RepID=A0A6A6RJI4_9PLEO|nr:hypothetical protein P280DRAFT_411396 [Massarina eburnea CBS 473.64]